MRPSKMPAFLAISLFAFVQTGGAAPPERYDVQLRYRINASRNQRISQFLAMTRYLEGLGFNKNPGEETEAEDPTETRMTGSISAGCRSEATFRAARQGAAPDSHRLRPA